MLKIDTKKNSARSFANNTLILRWHKNYSFILNHLQNPENPWRDFLTSLRWAKNGIVQ